VSLYYITVHVCVCASAPQIIDLFACTFKNVIISTLECEFVLHERFFDLDSAIHLERSINGAHIVSKRSAPEN